MSVSKNDLKKKKDIVATILEAKKINYDDWLDSQYQQVIEENMSFLQNTIQFYLKNAGKDEKNR
ncbi:hypothetical protein AF435_04475 [Listeria monocytogenes]|uniref:Uncharacterized protein n=1 Tax=Listeria monocytogenes TaxID=1639 RepID=A0AAN2WH34_LISMN|nr:hypothetical protein [Listeria monocytogenes]EAC3367746.1 hypothetical protein [Listeria monocytogenes]EAC7084975.1 hypothetical protein [Listeria monocytogenes]EAC8542001.1 hypothetical protein [Listeria monocytogenes]EAC8548002.1 hypothetical protein [Listeria monocytogenes]